MRLQIVFNKINFQVKVTMVNTQETCKLEEKNAFSADTAHSRVSATLLYLAQLLL